MLRLEPRDEPPTVVRDADLDAASEPLYLRSSVAFTDGEGRFVLRGLPSAHERILVMKRGHGAAFASVGPGRNEPLLLALSTAGGP